MNDLHVRRHRLGANDICEENRVKAKMKKESSWSETWEHEGHRLDVASENHGLTYLNVAPLVKNDSDKQQAYIVLRPEQLYALRELLDTALHDLENKGHWPKKPVMR